MSCTWPLGCRCYGRLSRKKPRVESTALPHWVRRSLSGPPPGYRPLDAGPASGRCSVGGERWLMVGDILPASGGLVATTPVGLELAAGLMPRRSTLPVYGTLVILSEIDNLDRLIPDSQLLYPASPRSDLLILLADLLTTIAMLLAPDGATTIVAHSLLTQHKCRRLYSSGRKGKPGPKSPSPELIQAIVEVNTPPAQAGGFGLRLKAGSISHAAD